MILAENENDILIQMLEKNEPIILTFPMTGQPYNISIL
jgi:hypothetical protein